MLCGAVLEPVAVVAGFQNMAVMRESVQQRRGHLGISEHIGPLAKAQVGGDHDARALVPELKAKLFKLDRLPLTRKAILKVTG